MIIPNILLLNYGTILDFCIGNKSLVVYILGLKMKKRKENGKATDISRRRGRCGMEKRYFLQRREFRDAETFIKKRWMEYLTFLKGFEEAVVVSINEAEREFDSCLRLGGLCR